MYKPINLPHGALMGLVIQSDINARENQEIIDLIQHRFEKFGAVRLLVVYEAGPGLIGAESLYDNMRFAKLAAENIARMAVISKHDWDSTLIGVFSLFGGLDARHFNRDAYKEALAWLAA